MRAALRGPSLLFGKAGAEKTGGGASAFCAKKARAGGGATPHPSNWGGWHAGGYPLRLTPARAHTHFDLSFPPPPN